MITMNRSVGRLIEGRFVVPYTIEEIHGAGRDLARIFRDLPGQAVAISDLRGADVIAQELFALFVPILKSDNPRIERSAFLLKPGAIFTKQVERLLREGGNAHRRSFLDAKEALAWIGEVLDPAERQRASEFLAG